MRRTRASTKQSSKTTVVQESSDEEPKQKIANKKQTKKSSDCRNDSSSSESDIENYLKPADEIDLSSSFFDTKIIEPQFNSIEKNILSGVVNRLSDSESSDEGVQDFASEKEVTAPKLNFQQLNDYMKKIEDAKEHISKYEAKKKLLLRKGKSKGKQKDENNLDVASLLKLGEKKSPVAESSANSIEMSYSDNSDDYESMTEAEDWEEVKEVKEKSIVPKDGVQITVEMPNTIRKKKGIDLLAAMKRRLNRIKKENQILIHKVHLLCWIAHGNFVNRVLNNQEILGMALSLIPSQQCYPSDRADLKYLEQILKWYGKTIEIVERKDDITVPIEKKLQTQISKKQAYSKRMLAFIFICVLRSLGIQCRLVMSLRVEPIRPPSSELCSLSTKTEDKNKTPKSKSGVEGEKKSIEKETKESQMLQNKTKESDKKHKKENKQALKETKQMNATKAEKSVAMEKTKSIEKETKGSQKLQNKTNESIKKHKKENKQALKETKQMNATKTEKSVAKEKTKGAVTSKATQIKKQKELNQPKIKSEGGRSNLLKDNTNKSISKSDKAKHDKNNKRPTDKDTDNSENEQTKKEASKQLSSQIRNKESDTKKSDKPPKVTKGSKPNLLKIKLPLKSKSPELEGKPNPKEDASKKIPQVDGLNDSGDDAPSTSNKKRKLTLKKLSETEINKCPIKKHPKRLRSLPDYKETDSEEEFLHRSPFIKKNINSPAPRNTNLKKLKERSKSVSFAPEIKCKYFGDTPRKQLDVRNDIVNLIKGRLVEQKQIDRSKIVKKAVRVDSDEDSDYYPEPIKKKQHDSEDEFVVKSKPKVKRRVQVKQDENPSQGKNDKKIGIDVWVEVFLEAEEHWISVDVVKQKVHCIQEIYKRATHPVSYVIAWNNDNGLKDVTRRYCPDWNTVTRKLRVDSKWWDQTLRPFLGQKTARDREEDEELARQQLDKPLPTAISEYKNHPLYVLKRHLLKFEAIYPPDAVTLGFVRNEPVYSRECVYTLHSREIWLKHAKVVKPGEKPYKIVKARPKWDKLSNSIITDQLLEIFGIWQVEDYVPPVAENGIVPRNAYGNVELFKACMLPKGTVHLQLPGLNKVARKLNIDCASAVIGFDFHSGWSHPTFDGFVVCEEFTETLTAAWEQEQEEAEKRAQEKIDKRVYDNWRRLIRGLLIRERLKVKYNFSEPSTSTSGGKSKRKGKGTALVVKKKRRICSDKESDSE